jgi:prepilin-type N-terminal cleavage/methylation domain-containing protein
MKFAGKTKGFTIVEMLTVMGIIAILIGLLVPALNQVKDYSKQIQQKAQFHGIEVGLEMFKAEFGVYPESNDNVDIYDNTKNHPNDAFVYCGANKMAEALVGLDLLGFHPNSEFRTTGRNIVTLKNGTITAQPGMTVYWAYNDAQLTWQTASENIQARKGPFIESENANAFRMDDIYPAASLTAGSYVNNYTVPGGTLYPLALCDVYAKKRDSAGNKKAGMPILYYRARTAYTLQDLTTTDVNGNNDDIYYYPDNYHLLLMGTPETTPITHPLYGGAPATYQQNFENAILNKQLAPVKRPYRAGSYILISAGKDGLYGTGDDIFNFDKGSEQQ